MSLKAINLALVDERTLLSKILKNYLGEHETINVVFHVSEPVDLFKKLNDFDINILLIDIFIYQPNALELLEAIRTEYPNVKILVLSKSMDVAHISELLEIGIHGYVSKMDDPSELLQAITALSEGKIHRNRLFTEALYWNKQNNERVYTAADLISLTEREKRVLQLLWEEKSNREIANEVFLSIRSIEKIRQDMKEKLDIKSTVGLLKYAIGKKIISINSIIGKMPDSSY